MTFVAKDYPTAEAAAKGLHEYLRGRAEAQGQHPDTEVAIFSPDETAERMDGYKAWWVMWEAGPHDWGVDFSLGRDGHGAHWYTEPYWGFDVMFIED